MGGSQSNQPHPNLVCTWPASQPSGGASGLSSIQNEPSGFFRMPCVFLTPSPCRQPRVGSALDMHQIYHDLPWFGMSK